MDASVRADWNSLVSEKRLFLRPRFLNILREGDPDRFRFLIAYRDEQPVAVMAFQLTHLAGRALRDYVPGPLAADPDREDKAGFRTWILNTLDRQQWRMVTTGTVFAPSEPGFAFHPALTSQEREGLLRSGLNTVCLDWEGVRLLLVTRTNLVMDGFNAITADSEMVFKLDSDWKTFEDYLKAMSSKYRVRANKVYKESASLIRKELGLEEVEAISAQLDQSYLDVAQRAGFNVAYLGKDHFLRMKREYGDDFVVVAWYNRADKLVGFHTGLMCRNQLEARYVGLDYEANARYRLYQRMLYDFIEMAFRYKRRNIHFGRTAPEIKSTVGALPQPAGYYLRHRNPVIRAVLAPFLKQSGPPQVIIRQPFRKKPGDPEGHAERGGTNGILVAAPGDAARE